LHKWGGFIFASTSFKIKEIRCPPEKPPKVSMNNAINMNAR